jgi:DivIVA domain-containing protein
VALDRQSIEKQDFPLARRGYNPEAVDAHLSAIAAEVEQLTQSARRARQSIADAAGDQVRAIVEAAEATASRIRAEAEEEARRVRAEARSEAEAAEADAAGRAGEQLDSVSKSAAAMLERIEALDHELTTMFEALRGGAERMNAELDQLHRELEGARGGQPAPAAAREPEPEPEPVAAAEPEPAPAARAEPKPAPDFEPEPELEAEPEPPRERQPAPKRSRTPGAASKAANADVEGARLIALNMALNGRTREEVDRYLSENYELGDRTALLDEVFASVEG